MKILIVSNMYPSEACPHYGVFVKNVCDGLVAQGNHCQVVAIHHTSQGAGQKLMRYGRFYLSAFWTVLTGKFDVVYVHFPSHSFVPVWLASWFRKHNIVLNFHGGDGKLHEGRSALFFRIKKYLNQKAIDAAKLVVVPSQPYADDLAGLYDLSRVKTLASPSGGVDPSLFGQHIRTPSEAPLHVAFVGRLVDVKRPQVFARCIARYFERYGDQQVTATVVGSGPQRARLEAMLEPYPVAFVDALSQQDLAAFFNKTDVLVQCSETESLGLVLIESMVAQCLPLCADNAAYRYLVSDSDSLFVSEDDFADKLHRVVQMSPEGRAELARNVAQQAVARFSHNNVIERLHHAFSQL
ncbi:glycosyltransferase family 4 protein [Ferrimonas balearica]|uniref:glycosyltransferase family 4 protein n=1 Tax=Ferrimonas balearica TaxID=44012 RepID=UPI001C948ED2|nr:glycosyltransferase family 4 protein [Ferrimonas balearica]MBY5978956.1 glycosyltransferase family 4 protein [Ferrimonas balearica]